MICYPNFNGRLGAIHISDVRPCFHQDRRLKFGRRNAHTKWNTMICICEAKLPQSLQSGRCVGPKAQLRASSGASLEVTAGHHLGVSVLVPV